MPFGHEVGDLVERAHDEIDKLHLADRAQPEITHAASRADDGALADRRVDDALPAEAFEQPFAGLERAAINANVLAEQDHRRIALHLFEHGLFDGFEKGDRRCPGASVRPGHIYLRAFRAPDPATARAAFLATFAGAFAAPCSLANCGAVSPK